MAANFDLTALAVEGCCPGNVVKVDDVGLPSIMVRIPKLTYKQLGMGESEATHPAFIVNGQEVEEILISKYQNVVNNGRAYSLGGVDPRANITFDAAREACEAKGEGWHLMTKMEWGLLVRWCQKNGVMPKGNNDFGKHNTESVYKAIPTLRDSAEQNYRPLRVATGTGPLTWYHDQTLSGIADLCGNVWEWSGGIRSVEAIEKYLDLGVMRVILGTAAVTDSEFLKKAVSTYGEKVAVGVDIKDGKVAIKGWTQVSELTCFDFCRQLEDLGVKTVICTDISKDGVMSGTNIELYKDLSAQFKMDIVASGGVSNLENVRTLTEMNMYGAILGKALYTGSIDLKEAIKIASGVAK